MFYLYERHIELWWQIPTLQCSLHTHFRHNLSVLQLLEYYRLTFPRRYRSLVNSLWPAFCVAQGYTGNKDLVAWPYLLTFTNTVYGKTSCYGIYSHIHTFTVHITATDIFTGNDHFFNSKTNVCLAHAIRTKHNDKVQTVHKLKWLIFTISSTTIGGIV